MLCTIDCTADFVFLAVLFDPFHTLVCCVMFIQFLIVLQDMCWTCYCLWYGFICLCLNDFWLFWLTVLKCHVPQQLIVWMLFLVEVDPLWGEVYSVYLFCIRSRVFLVMAWELFVHQYRVYCVELTCLCDCHSHAFHILTLSLCT